MNTPNIADLRSRLVAATDYSEFHNYCVENFFENEGFRRLGRPLSARQVDQMVRVCLELYLGGPPKKVMAIQANLREIPEFRFIYGFLSIAGKLSSIVYFDDLDQGMMTIIENMETLDTQFVQFHLQPQVTEKPN